MFSEKYVSWCRLRNAPAGGSSREEIAVATNATFTVLMVDDNRDLLDIFRDLLTDVGHYRVATATNGVQALEKCMEVSPDCMVIDVKMPGLDGYQLVRALRGDPATEQIPLIILSAMAQDRDKFVGMLSGVDRYLIKPVTPLELIAVIQEVIAVDAPARLQRMQRLAEGEG
jgi:CheY-like chemotaxis protein